MASIKQVFLLVAVLAVTLVTLGIASAGSITGLEVNGVQTVGNSVNIGSITGDTLPVEINFVSSTDSSESSDEDSGSKESFAELVRK